MDIIQEAKNLALKEIKKFGIPSLVHLEISEKKALDLAEKLNADKTITLVGYKWMSIEEAKKKIWLEDGDKIFDYLEKANRYIDR